MSQLVERVEIQNNEYVRASANVTYAENAIAEAERVIARNLPIVEALEKDFSNRYTSKAHLEEQLRMALRAKLLELFPEITSEIADSIGLETNFSFSEVLQTRYLNANNAFRSSVDRLEAAKKDLLILREKLEDLDPAPILYDKHKIDEALSKVEGVVPGSVYITKNRDVYRLHWHMHSLTASVNNLNADSVPWFHVDQIDVPIGACEVALDLHSGQIRLTPESEEDALYMWEGESNIHPHILNYHIPCFGDFSGPIVEAVSEQDWETVGSLIYLFLGQIDAQDSAGAHWSQYFRRKFGDRRVLDRHGEAYPSSLGYKHYFKDADNNWIVKISKHPTQYEEINPISISAIDEMEVEMGLRSPNDSIPDMSDILTRMAM